jgi:hypothetical protein
MLSKPAKPGTHTHEALCSKAAAKRAHQDQLAIAVGLHASGGGGGMQLSKMVEGCSRQQIDRAIAKSVLKQPPRPQWEILTEYETTSLVKWVLASAANDNPAVENEVSEQVRRMLLCRRLYNRKKKSGKPNASTVELTTAELRIAIDNGDLSHTWFQHFYADNPQCQMKTAHRQEARRVGKQREPTVERHFFGEFGLKVHLTARGIMDAAGIILDRRRLLNGDEMPAFLDFLTHSTKALGEKGKPLQRSTEENRECATVMMAGDLGGFIYGPQYLIARKHFQSAYGDCTEPWADIEDYGELCHDDKIYLLEQRSTFSLVSLTDKGVQTGSSFADFLRFLRLQIDARNVALLAAAHKPIEFPVVFLGDNHGSRFDEEVLAMTDPDDSKFCGILLDFEESCTSQFLQDRIVVVVLISAHARTVLTRPLRAFRCGTKSIRRRTRVTTRERTSTKSNTCLSSKFFPARVLARPSL